MIIPRKTRRYRLVTLDLAGTYCDFPKLPKSRQLPSCLVVCQPFRPVRGATLSKKNCLLCISTKYNNRDKLFKFCLRTFCLCLRIYDRGVVAYSAEE